MPISRSGPPLDGADAPVGVALARLRRRAGLTGKELGDLVGMSQAKISKIETGAVNPSPEDVERMARQLRAPAAEIDRLTQQAEQHRDRMMDWRSGRTDLATWQRKVAQLEADCAELRVFQFGVISGLLQTSEYARAVLGAVHAMWTDTVTPSSTRVSQAVSARMQRQEILDDPAKQLHFVLPETLLYNLLTEPRAVPAQLDRLREVARQDNVTLKILPDDALWPYPPFHSFSLLDDHHVIIDLANTVVVTEGKADIQLYRNVFDTLESRATGDIESILEKHIQRYLRMAAER